MLILSACLSSPPAVDTQVPAEWEVSLAAQEPSPNKKRLLNFLADEYGKRIISGQMDTSWTINEDMDMIARVYADTGKYPALKGFDLLQHPYDNWPYRGGREQIDEAVEWWEGRNNDAPLLANRPNVHGIVAFCWHWRAGQSVEFYTNKTSFRIPWKNGRLDMGSDNFKAIIRDLDAAASLLNVLKEKDIPVLWRPLHEAAGGWFWWGASGAQPYIALWEFMYHYFTNVKGLNNLIWVWNGENTAWFPNAVTVDIAGLDLYNANYSSRKREFEKSLAKVSERDLIIALTENDKLPDPDECIKDGTMWSWFMTWNDMRFSDGETHKDNFWTGEFHNPQAHKRKVYNHSAVITLDKLPDLTAYRLE
jgi:mannan endo-1,4-beta-mannosidase